MISQVFQQNEATAAHARVYLHFIDSSDNVSGKTGLTGTLYVEKNGGTPAATTNSLVEIDATHKPGDYSLDLTATELDTLGVVRVGGLKTGALYASAGGAVVPYDPYAAPDKTGYSLSTAGNNAVRDSILSDATRFAGAAIAAIPTANQNADAYLDRTDAIETGLTPRNALRLMAAALAGQASGLATTTAVFKSALSALKNRITATVDADGNRTTVTTDLT